MPEDAITAGQRLLDDLTGDDDPYAITVMIIEAARITDRLANLDKLLTGEVSVWAQLREGRDGDVYVYVDNALAEARQQATVLRHLISEIQRQRGQIRTAPPDDDLAGL